MKPKSKPFINTETRNLKRYRKRVLSENDIKWLLLNKD